jgi:hypothetical protein
VHKKFWCAQWLDFTVRRSVPLELWKDSVSPPSESSVDCGLALCASPGGRPHLVPLFALLCAELNFACQFRALLLGKLGRSSSLRSQLAHNRDNQEPRKVVASHASGRVPTSCIGPTRSCGSRQSIAGARLIRSECTRALRANGTKYRAASGNRSHGFVRVGYGRDPRHQHNGQNENAIRSLM